MESLLDIKNIHPSDLLTEIWETGNNPQLTRVLTPETFQMRTKRLDRMRSERGVVNFYRITLFCDLLHSPVTLCSTRARQAEKLDPYTSFRLYQNRLTQYLPTQLSIREGFKNISS